MVTIEELLDELEHEAQATRRVLERVPGDRLNWRPHPKSFTLGQLALHVATLPGAIADVATWPSFDVRLQVPRPSPENTAELLGAFARSIADARATLEGMDDAALASPWSMVDGDRELWTMPRRDFLRSVLFNHWYHHRGQLTVYLRQVGALVPATYGDTADEKPSFIT